MSELTPLTRDLSVFNKLELEKPPVGVKFLFGEPEGIPAPRTDPRPLRDGRRGAERQGLLRRPRRPRVRRPRPPGDGRRRALLLERPDRPLPGDVQGGAGQPPHLRRPPHPREGAPATTRCSRPWTSSTFDPDVLVLTGRARKMEIVLRSMSWTTGQMYESKGTPVLGCAWTLVYPYITGKINFSVTGPHVRPHRPRGGHRGQRHRSRCPGTRCRPWWRTSRRCRSCCPPTRTAGRTTASASTG